MFIETKEGQTHATCEEQLKKYGGKAKCCLCNTHDGCTIANSEGMFSPHEMTKAIKHAMKVSKKEQDKIMPPDEFCPECMSLKRKPNKECVNHEKYWIKPTPAKGRNYVESSKYAF